MSNICLLQDVRCFFPADANHVLIGLEKQGNVRLGYDKQSLSSLRERHSRKRESVERYRSKKKGMRIE